MEKEKTKKKVGSFIIRDYYQRNGAKAKDLMERDIYGKIVSKLG